VAGTVTTPRIGEERPLLGFGLGLRSDHYDSVLSERPEVDCFEILSENYMVPGGKPLHYLERIRAHYPMVMHGVSLSIGSCDPLDAGYLTQLRTLATRLEPEWISDHLCWTGVDGVNLHDLMPLPYTEAALHHVAARIARVQEFLGRQILIENVSSYVDYRQSEMTEWEFINAVAERADCLILLDINNVYVNAFNHGFDPYGFIDHIAPARVREYHVAGHTNELDYIVDTHDAQVIEPVWNLYVHAVHRLGPAATILERDDNIPALHDLLTELAHARRAHEVAIGGFRS